MNKGAVGQKIVRNSIYGVISQVIGGGIFFLIAIFMARHLGPERFGSFSFVFAFVTIFHMLADFGLTNILVREISRRKDQAANILGAVLPLVTLLSCSAYGVIWLVVPVLPLDEEASQATYIMGATVLVTFHAAVYGSVCRAYEEMEFNAIGLSLQRIVLLILVWTAISKDAGLVGFAYCYLGERIFQWIFFYVLIRKRYARYEWRIDKDYWQYLIREGFPIGIGMVLRRVTWHIDIFILAAIATASSVGLFGAAYRVIQMIQVIPFTLSLPVFPLLSQQAKVSPEKVFAIYLKILRVFMLLGMPIGIWFVFLGSEFMVLLFGYEYGKSGVALQVMGLVVVLLFLNSLFVLLFSSLNKQRSFMICAAISVVVNVLVDLALIPFFGILGAAIGTLCAEVTLFIAGITFLSRLGLNANYFKLISPFVLAILISCCALLWPIYKPSIVNMILGSLGFAILFGGTSYLLGIFSRAEIQVLVEAMPSIKPPGRLFPMREKG